MWSTPAWKHYVVIRQRAPLKLMEFSFPVITILSFACKQRTKYQRNTLEKKIKKKMEIETFFTEISEYVRL